MKALLNSNSIKEKILMESEILINLTDEEFEKRRQYILENCILENYPKDSSMMEALLIAMRFKIEKRIKKRINKLKKI